MPWRRRCRCTSSLATTLGSREQLAIAEFAEALLVIPKVLSVNAAKDSTELVAKLRAYHHAAQTKPEKKHLAGYGLDLVKGELKDNLNDGVLEPALSKVKSIQFATEAAITILRIDDLIKLHPEEGQQAHVIRPACGFPDAVGSPEKKLIRAGGSSARAARRGAI